MECTKVREFLSEYIDGLLEDGKKAPLEEHLKACKACRDELLSLKTLVQELGSLDTVPAPKDFLEQVHNRMETPSRLSRMLHLCFIPFRVKIPLEFAGAAVVALLLFFVFQTETPVVHRSPKPQDLPGEMLARKAPPSTGEIPSKEGTLPVSISGAEQTIVEKRQKRAPIELALLITGFPERDASKPLTLVDAPSPQKKGRKKLARAKIETTKDLSGEGDIADLETEAQKALPAPSSPAAPMKAKSRLEEGYSAMPLDEVTEFIALAGGEIEEVRDAMDGSGTYSFLLKIPAHQYPHLLENLKTVGKLQIPDSPPEDLAGDLQVHLRLLFPK